MNTINDDSARQQAQDWSRQLGELAAGLQTGKPQTDFAQVAGEADPTSLRTRLPTLLARYLHCNSAQQHAEHKLKANEFMSGG